MKNKSRKIGIINLINSKPKDQYDYGGSLIWAQRLSNLKGVKVDFVDNFDDLLSYDELYYDPYVSFACRLNIKHANKVDWWKCFCRLKKLFSFIVKKPESLFFIDWHPFRKISNLYPACQFVGNSDKLIGCFNGNHSDSYFDQLETSFLVNLPEEFDYGNRVSLNHYINYIVKSKKNVNMSMFKLPEMIIGDSHSLAFSNVNQAVYPHTGLLLYSFINKLRLDTAFSLTPYIFHNRADKIVLCLGSNDIRFHVFGNKNELSAKQFARLYRNVVLELNKRHQLNLSVCLALPVEDETDIKPEQMYNGESYVGSAKERREYTLRFNDELVKGGLIDVISPPSNWYSIHEKSYRDVVLEKNSLHLKTKAYNSVLKWKNKR